MLYGKFHSWQCIKLTIPSCRVNFAIEESINIFCLEIILVDFFQIKKIFVYKINLLFTWKFLSFSNSYLEIWNGLQSVCSPFVHATKSVKRTTFQSIISLFDFCILRPTRWDRLLWQVQIMTNQIRSPKRFPKERFLRDSDFLKDFRKIF